MAKKLAKAEMGTSTDSIRRRRINNLNDRSNKVASKALSEARSSSPNQNKINRLNEKSNRLDDRQMRLIEKDQQNMKNRINASQQANMNMANQAALEKVRAPAVKQLSMDEMYAASKATADSIGAANKQKFIKSVMNQPESKLAKEARERFLIDSMTNLNKKAGGTITRPITALDQVDRMEKAKLGKTKK